MTARASLAELPSPPEGKRGWPWTEGSPPAEAEGAGWPSVSIVVPSYNQGRYLEGTLRSILLQGYPKLELFVMDGGSTDESVEILRRYERWLTGWVSERDGGQTYAISKGLARSTGEVFNWINSDDQLAPAALHALAEEWSRSRPHLLAGRGLVVEGEEKRVVHDWPARGPRGPVDFVAPHGVVMSQPSTFISRAALDEVGGLRDELHYVMDWELYLRFSLHYREKLRVAVTPALLSYSLSHAEAKTSKASLRFREEAERILVERRADWRPEEWKVIRAYLQRLQVEAEVAAALGGAERPLVRLASLALRVPRALTSRLYWGGVRRILLQRSE